MDYLWRPVAKIYSVEEWRRKMHESELKHYTPEEYSKRMGRLYNYPVDGFEQLDKVISFKNFDYSSASYRNQEVDILQPQLERLGYSEIVWLPGETDSFGPLTRVCRAFDLDGNLHWFYYG